MNAEEHYKRKRQIRVLQDYIIMTCTDQEDKRAIQDLIKNLKHSNNGTILKRELAQLYGISMITLNKRIEQTEGLRHELFSKFGYTKWRKCLMPLEVEIVEKYLGNPIGIAKL